MSAVQDDVHDGLGPSENGDDDRLEDFGDLEGEPPSTISQQEEDTYEGEEAEANTSSFNNFKKKPYELRDTDPSSPPSSRDGPERPSSAEDSSSIPDDSPSLQGSFTSSPSRGALGRSYSRSPTPSLKPFDRRFQARLSSSSTIAQRAASPAFLTSHSRNSSAAWTLQDGKDTEIEVPWEVVRWTKLKKMTAQAFSEIGKRNFGRPTCIAVSALIILGTSRGIILLFDYNQNLKTIIGPGTKALEAGAITSVSISADHSTIAGGHASGAIFTWEVVKPGKPFLHIPPLDRSRDPRADGHFPDAAVLHLGFLGIRHTALSSADDKGMAFSHLATRGMGMVARTVKTTRILGRYPERTAAASASRKPSSVLAFSPLPLGNTEHAADGMGLVAMLTPYLLVIVSTMPIAQTQSKTPRPKEVASHSAMTGALAWFPSVRLRTSQADASDSASMAKLVYCWSNILTILDVVVIEPSEKDGKSEPTSLQFKPRSRWKSEEAIVGIQWLSRSVLAALTISQQLVIIEDYSMLVTDSSDLLQKHIYHTDLFSSQLNQLVDKLDDEEVASMHGVVADAFHMSFRAYKGRLFLLGHSEISFGTLSNWADRLHALVEEGSYIRAIELATGYYTGEADKVTVGLPEDDGSRHKLVREKVLELISASLKFAFGRRNVRIGQYEHRQHTDQLAQACITACISIGNLDFLFDEVYPWYEEDGLSSVLLEDLEPHIENSDITVLPPEVVKDLVNHYTSRHLESRLEELLCLLDPRTMDIDQVTTLCKAHGLYDALLYVWNQAMGDFTTIMSELLSMGLPQSNGHVNDSHTSENMTNASRVFPYLSYILTGRIYPTGQRMSSDQANLAKADIYNFFFSGKGSDGVPRGDLGPQSPRHASRTNFPNLRKVLNFDSSSFLSMLNEAFEDSFLNGPQERLPNETPGGLTEAQKFGLSVNRQWVVSILLEVMTPPSYEPDDTIYLDMFIARNLPKFPQFILLPGHVLQKVLVGLCGYPSEEVAEDCQLSVEYLLSMYQPPDMRSLIPNLHEARFWRVLMGVYKAERQFGQLLEVYFEDKEQIDGIYDCIADCLTVGSGLNENQVEEVRSVIARHAQDLIHHDVTKTALTIDTFAADLHTTMLQVIEDNEELQFQYLRGVLEPASQDESEERQSSLPRSFIEQYVRLMCEYDPSHVSTYIDHLKTGDLRLEEVLPALEEGGAVDAAVVLMAREGKVRDGIDRLTQHLQSLEAALVGLLEGRLGATEEELAENEISELIESIHKYVRVGIWMCQGQTRSAARTQPRPPRRKSTDAIKDAPSADEELWLDLLDAVVSIVKNATEVLERLKRSLGQATNENDTPSASTQWSKQITDLRTIVQEAFTALLNTTTGPTPRTNTTNSEKNSTNRRADLSFLRILRAFLTRASKSSPTLSNLRAVFNAIFSAYSYEEELLSLSNKLLDQDLFVHVTDADKLRRRGWRPLGQVCEGCGRRVWGPGAGGGVWEAWERARADEERQRQIRRRAEFDGGSGYDGGGGGGGRGAAGKGRSIDDGGSGAGGRESGQGQSRGKGKALTSRSGGDGGAEGQIAIPEGDTGSGKEELRPGSGPVVVFACRHMFHLHCLERMKGTGGKREGGDGDAAHGGDDDDLTCPLEV